MSGDSGISVVLTGQDGMAWDLVSHTSPVAILASSVSGLHIEEITPQVVTSARIPGQRRAGVSVAPRKIDLTVRVGDESPPYRTGDAWRDLDSSFWRSVGVGQPCTLQVADRSIDVVLDGSTPSFDRDPAIFGKGIYTLELTADWPYFHGDEVSFSFDLSPTTGTNFFGGGSGTKGPPFVLGLPQAATSASVYNPGDVQAWVRWTLVGPGSFTVGVGSDQVAFPIALARDQIVKIDSDPRRQTIVNATTGQNLWPIMGSSAVRFAPIPPGDSQPILIQVTGAQSGTMVGAAITPQFSRAW